MFRLHVWLLVGVLAFTAVTPRPARAFLGIGDISHDPLLMAGMFGQTGAQMAQMVQTYYLLVDMKNRYGSLTKLSTWKKMLKSYAVRSLQNLARQIVFDIRQRGARITSETPTNPILSTVTTGRNALAKLEDRYNRADDLQIAYAKSEWSVARPDREQQIRDKQAAADKAIAAASASGDQQGAVALSGDAHASRPEDPNKSAQTGSGSSSTNPSSSSTSSNSSSTSSSGSGKSGNTVPIYVASAGSTPAPSSGNSTLPNDGATGNSSKVIGGLGLARESVKSEDTADLEQRIKDGKVFTDYQIPLNPGLLDSTHNGQSVEAAETSKTLGSTKSMALLHHSAALLAGGVIQEHDAAIKCLEDAMKQLRESQEAMDEANMKGPEPKPPTPCRRLYPRATRLTCYDLTLCGWGRLGG